MLRLLNYYSRNRAAWFLLFLSVLCIEVMALYFQHYLGLKPCILCIYQRCALLGILCAAGIAMLSPKRFLLRFIALIIWIYCAIKGFLLAYEKAILQLEPPLFQSCTIDASFPSWLPLNVWFPAMFESFNSCSNKPWHFLTLDMSQWMIILFGFYTLAGITVLISQPLRLPQRKTWQ